MTDATSLDRMHQRVLRAEQRERDQRERQRRHTRQLQERGDRLGRYASRLKHSRASAPRRQQHHLLAEQRYWLNIYRRPM